MSHLIPRPPAHQAHHRTQSNSQPLDKRVEIVSKLENCIGEVLKATKTFKSPQQQSAHQNANQMFQQRIMASQGNMGGLSAPDWVGTMMQCLNESMRAQQSSFVRNTTLDVALKNFAAGIFDVLGPEYFQETIDKHLSTRSRAPHDASKAASGIPSPPREMGPTQTVVHRPAMQPMQSMPSGVPVFPSAHQMPVHPSPTHHQPHPMPSSTLPQSQGAQHHHVKRPSIGEPSNAPSRKRRYTTEALRQAAGATAPQQPHPPSQHGVPHPMCIDFLEVYQQADPRRRQAILSYSGKWYIFRCHRHKNTILFKTGEGAKHHLVHQHARAHQHIDLLDMIRELGVEVLNCDAYRANLNNIEAAALWKQMDMAPSTQLPPHPVGPAPTPAVAADTSVCQNTTPTALMPAEVVVKMDSSSAIEISDDEATVEVAVTEERVIIKDEAIDSPRAVAELPSNKSDQTQQLTEGPCLPIAETAEATQVDQEAAPVLPEQGDESSQPAEAEKKATCLELEVLSTNTSAPTTKPVSEQLDATLPDASDPPEMVVDSPESSDLSEPPSFEELEAFEKESLMQQTTKSEEDELEEGEIDESCIVVSPVSYNRPNEPPLLLNYGEDGKTKDIKSAAGSASPSPIKRRRRLPSTPKSSEKRKHKKSSFWSPPKQDGPSAHDQFKTKACKKCTERFYFRAQLATHMESEHPEVVIIAQ